MVDGKEVLPVYRVEDGLKRRSGKPIIVLCAADYHGMERQLECLGYFCGDVYIHSDLFRFLLSL